MTMPLRSTPRRASLQHALGAAFVSMLGARAADVPDDTCGGDHVKGDPTMLYDCSSAGLVPVQRRANGCEWMPDGKHDRCAH